MDQGLLSEFPSRSLIRVKTLASIGFYSYYLTSEKDQLIVFSSDLKHRLIEFAENTKNRKNFWIIWKPYNRAWPEKNFE